MPNQPQHVAIIMLNTEPAWLALNHTKRDAFNAEVIAPIFANYASTVQMRLIDMEAFTGRCTDVMLLEFTDLTQYYFLLEELRDTELFSKLYFSVVDILLGIEGGFRLFEEMLAQRNPN